MYILSKTTNEYGGYGVIQSWDGPPPEGCFQVPDTFDFDEYQSYNGFVNLAVKRNVVIGFTPNTEAWEEWKASLPPTPEPEPEPQPGGSSDADAILNVLLGVTE